jgi:preprotein translocase subunit SecA
MAGRGTDIKLGEGVVELGGLHVLGTERHEARRIDNQLRGRGGRQGDPGSSRFYLSLEDDLMRLFGSDKLSGIMLRLGMEEGQNIDSSLVSRAISSAQKRVENRNFEIRKHLLEYDNVMNDQRDYIYGKRTDFLGEGDTEDKIVDSARELLGLKREEFELPRSGITEETASEFVEWFAELIGKPGGVAFESAWPLNLDTLTEEMIGIFKKTHREKVSSLGEELAPQVERFIALQSIDRRWKEHLYEMDGLREGIGYQAYAQKDPLVEYKFQAFTQFQELITNINTDLIRNIFRVRIVQPSMKKQRIWNIKRVQHEEYEQFGARSPYDEAVSAEGGRDGEAAFVARGASPSSGLVPGMRTSAASQYQHRRERAQIVVGDKVGRNDPCPCGSGKKYKYCCGK